MLGEVFSCCGAHSRATVSLKLIYTWHAFTFKLLCWGFRFRCVWPLALQFNKLTLVSVSVIVYLPDFSDSKAWEFYSGSSTEIFFKDDTTISEDFWKCLNTYKATWRFPKRFLEVLKKMIILHTSPPSAFP